MRPFPIEELVDRCGSRFTVVVAAAKRAKQIKEGAPPLVNLSTRNPLTIALHEIAAGLVEITEEPVIEELAPTPAAELALGELAAPEAVEALLVKDLAEELTVATEELEIDLDDEAGDDLDEVDESDDEDDDEDDDEEETEDEDDWDEDEE